jgi:1-phosphofructokinase
MGISSDFISVSRGISRINVKLKTDADTETEINGQGPVIEQGELEQLFDKLKKLTSGDFLVLSGNVPKSIPSAEHTYERICKAVSSPDIMTVIDAEGDLLRNTLCEQPFLIKPNQQELERLFDVTMMNMEDICFYAKKLKAEGAQNVLVTLAGKGAILLDEHGELHTQAASKGIVQNSVGAGDSLIAGFLARLCQNNMPGAHSFHSSEYDKALKFGVAAGSAGAFSRGLPDKAKIEEVFSAISNSVIIGGNN